MFPPLTWRGREELASAPPPRVEDRNTANRGAVKPVWTTDGVFGRLKRTSHTILGGFLTQGVSGTSLIHPA